MRRPAHNPDCPCACHVNVEFWAPLYGGHECLVCRSDRRLLGERIREQYPPAAHMCGACGGNMAAPMEPCVKVFRSPRPYLSRVRYHGLPEPVGGPPS